MCPVTAICASQGFLSSQAECQDTTHDRGTGEAAGYRRSGLYAARSTHCLVFGSHVPDEGVDSGGLFVLLGLGHLANAVEHGAQPVCETQHDHQRLSTVLSAV